MTGDYLKVPSSHSHSSPHSHSSSHSRSSPHFHSTLHSNVNTSTTGTSSSSRHPDPAFPISLDPVPLQSLHSFYFHMGSLLSSSFRCSAILGELDEPVQALVAGIGRQLSISQRVCVNVGEMFVMILVWLVQFFKCSHFDIACISVFFIHLFEFIGSVYFDCLCYVCRLSLIVWK